MSIFYLRFYFYFLDAGYVDEVRGQIPLRQQKRKDLYEITERVVS